MKLLGQSEALEKLRRTVQQGRVSNCYLFSGPDGIGKVHMARWFAQLLCCISELERRPCGQCLRCKRLREGSGPDLVVFEEASHPTTLELDDFPGVSLSAFDEALGQLHELGLLARPARGLGRVRVCSRAIPEGTSADPESDFGAALKQLEPSSLPAMLARNLFFDKAVIRYDKAPELKALQRSIIRQVPLRPVEMPYRFFLLDDAHTLRPEAQNALLKTLEEPPPSSILMLVSSKPNRLLPTIISRCQNIVARALKEAELVSLLEAKGANPADAALSARLAGGSALAALSFEPQSHRAARDALLSALECRGGRAEAIQCILEAIGQNKSAERQERQRLLEQRLGLLLDLLRDAMILAEGGRTDRLKHVEALELLRNLALRGAWGLSRVSGLVLDAQSRLATNANVDLQIVALGSRLYEILASPS